MDFAIYPVFALIAAVYASVGFGGGSSYLAVLQLLGIPFLPLRATALLCNLTVVSGGTWLFFRRGHLPWGKVWPLVATSVPMAFVGGRLPIGAGLFYGLLGGALVAAAALMWFRSFHVRREIKMRQYPIGYASILGGAIGFLSGMVGIGGGIFLAPVLHLLRWDTPVRIAATASFFILVNSAAGLAGQLLRPDFYVDGWMAAGLMVAVFIGGQIGSRLGSGRLSPVWIRRTTAVLVFVVGWRVLGGWPF